MAASKPSRPFARKKVKQAANKATKLRRHHRRRQPRHHDRQQHTNPFPDPVNVRPAPAGSLLPPRPQIRRICTSSPSRRTSREKFLIRSYMHPRQLHDTTPASPQPLPDNRMSPIPIVGPPRLQPKKHPCAASGLLAPIKHASTARDPMSELDHGFACRDIGKNLYLSSS